MRKGRNQTSNKNRVVDREEKAGRVLVVRRAGSWSGGPGPGGQARRQERRRLRPISSWLRLKYIRATQQFFMSIL